MHPFLIYISIKNIKYKYIFNHAIGKYYAGNDPIKESAN